MRLDPTQQALIARLADGHWHSGADLSKTLEISREAISKRIAKLEEMGLQLHKQSGRGYQLCPAIKLLDAQQIHQGLAQRLPVQVLQSVASTNQWLSEQALAPALCLAEHQSSGRGRRGRQWQSPYGQNLYMSLSWELDSWPEKLPALSLVLGIRLCESLRDLSIAAQIKWPNDLYLNGRKFGGLLIEQRGEAQGPCRLIIGLGLNVDMREHAAIDQQWTSLACEGISADRSVLAIRLAQTMMDELEQLNAQRLEAILQRFTLLDAFSGRMVQIRDGDRLSEGRSLGVDAWGRLLLDTGQKQEKFNVGDVSLRPST